MAPDRRALFEAAYGALMIRSARPQPVRPAPHEGAEQTPNSLSASSLTNVDSSPRARS
jgi:hypothetical protein